MAGRPPTYSTPEELQTAIDAYFDEEPEKPTISGMAYYLGFESRQSIYDYAEKGEFSYTIKRAIGRIEDRHERNLYESGASGSIFWLKNRGWVDRTDHDHTTKGESFNPDLSKLTDAELRTLAEMQSKSGAGKA